MYIKSVKRYNTQVSDKNKSFKRVLKDNPETSENNKQKSNAAKYMIGASIAAGVAALAISGYRRHFSVKNLINKDLKNAEQFNPESEILKLKNLKNESKVTEAKINSQTINSENIKKENKVTTPIEPENVKNISENVKITHESNTNLIDWDVPLKARYDITSGNYANYEYMLKQLKENPAVLKLLKELENKTFDSSNLNLIKDFYDKENVYDLGFRYIILANNTAKQKGNAFIINKIPDMFDGIDSNELCKKIDNLASLLDCRKVNKFVIGNKEYIAKHIGGGCLGDVYKITYPKTGEKVCIKFARQPYLTGRGQGIFDEIAISNEANKAGVIDIPKLYMANPIGRYVTLPEGYITNNGAWQMTEFIEAGKVLPDNGLTLLKWLDSKGLYHGDCHGGNCIGNTIIDLGGVLDKEHTIVSFKDMEALLRAYQNGESTASILKKAELSL